MAGHLRLFREARAALQTRPQGGDLVQLFFDKEAEKERDICRDSICLKEESEKGALDGAINSFMLYRIVGIASAHFWF